MEKILGTEVIHMNRYAKVLVDPTVNAQNWVSRFCYKCDVKQHIIWCDYCEDFQFNGYFKKLGSGI